MKTLARAGDERYWVVAEYEDGSLCLERRHDGELVVDLDVDRKSLAQLVACIGEYFALRADMEIQPPSSE